MSSDLIVLPFIYLFIGVFVTIVCSLLMAFDDYSDSDVKRARMMVAWAWFWPIGLPTMLFKGFYRIVKG